MNALRLLAIETSSATGSVALASGHEILERTIATPREQTDRILGLVDELLKESGMRLGDLDALVFGCGPGSFTGLRIAAAVTQGLSLASGCPILAVSSLAGLAQRALTDAADAPRVERALCVVDARMGEVYAAGYRLTDGLAVLDVAEGIGPPEAVVAPSGPYLAIGDGLAAYPEALAAVIEGAAASRPELAARAQDLLTQAARDARDRRFVPLEAAVPVYLREATAWRRS